MTIVSLSQNLLILLRNNFVSKPSNGITKWKLSSIYSLSLFFIRRISNNFIPKPVQLRTWHHEKIDRSIFTQRDIKGGKIDAHHRLVKVGFSHASDNKVDYFKGEVCMGRARPKFWSSGPVGLCILAIESLLQGCTDTPRAVPIASSLRTPTHSFRGATLQRLIRVNCKHGPTVSIPLWTRFAWSGEGWHERDIG